MRLSLCLSSLLFSSLLSLPNPIVAVLTTFLPLTKMVAMAAGSSCWIRLPSGCTNLLSETATPTVWFVDPGNQGTDCQANRLADFNSHCGRADAQSLWGAMSVTDASISSQGSWHTDPSYDSLLWSASQVLVDDGDQWAINGGIWLTPNLGASWFILDLLGEYTLEYFNIKNIRNADYDDRGTNTFKIEVSADQWYWTEAVPTTTLEWNLDLQQFNSNVNAAVRYVKFTVVTFYNHGGGLGFFEAVAGVISLLRHAFSVCQ